MMPPPKSSGKTETPRREAGRPIVLQHPAGEYPERRALGQQRVRIAKAPPSKDDDSD